MPHVFEPATSGRAKCRGCGKAIGRGEVRFGENVANPFAEGETTIWFHPICAAFKRPESVLQALAETQLDVQMGERLETLARASTAQRRLVRIDGAERAPSSQAKCRCCQKPIERGTWRIRLVYFEDVRFTPGGFVHLDCRGEHFEGHDVRERVLHFSTDLDEGERADLERALAS